MLGPIIGVLILIGVIFLVLYVVGSQFPNLAKLWLAAAIATAVLAVIRALHGWFCGWLCG